MRLDIETVVSRVTDALMPVVRAAIVDVIGEAASGPASRAALRPSTARAIRVVCAEYSVTLEQLRGRGQVPELVEPRHLACWLLHDVSRLSYAHIARIMRRNRSTVEFAIAKIRRDLAENTERGQVAQDLARQLREESRQ